MSLLSRSKQAALASTAGHKRRNALIDDVVGVATAASLDGYPSSRLGRCLEGTEKYRLMLTTTMLLQFGCVLCTGRLAARVQIFGPNRSGGYCPHPLSLCPQFQFLRRVPVKVEEQKNPKVIQSCKPLANDRDLAETTLMWSRTPEKRPCAVD